VSLMTSGLWDQLLHALWSKSASSTFRAGFIGWPNHPGYPSTDASSVANLEMRLRDFTYGFSTSPSNCAVGWPSLAYLRNDSVLAYRSDAMCWNPQCTFEAPEVVNGTFSWIAPSMPTLIWQLPGNGSNSPNQVQLDKRPVQTNVLTRCRRSLPIHHCSCTQLMEPTMRSHLSCLGIRLPRSEVTSRDSHNHQVHRAHRFPITAWSSATASCQLTPQLFGCSPMGLCQSAEIVPPNTESEIYQTTQQP
jgi:hypothetical protein